MNKIVRKYDESTTTNSADRVLVRTTLNSSSTFSQKGWIFFQLINDKSQQFKLLCADPEAVLKKISVNNHY